VRVIVILPELVDNFQNIDILVIPLHHYLTHHLMMMKMSMVMVHVEVYRVMLIVDTPMLV
jgi:hypothetical protein